MTDIKHNTGPAFLRLYTIVGRPAYKGDPKADPPKPARPAVPGLLPISKSSWWNGIKEGVYPRGVKISKHVTAWPANAIHDLIEKLGRSAEVAPVGRKKK